jgi:hypothetical protein
VKFHTAEQRMSGHELYGFRFERNQFLHLGLSWTPPNFYFTPIDAGKWSELGNAGRLYRYRAPFGKTVDHPMLTPTAEKAHRRSHMQLRSGERYVTQMCCTEPVTCRLRQGWAEPTTVDVAVCETYILCITAGRTALAVLLVALAFFNISICVLSLYLILRRWFFDPTH